MGLQKPPSHCVLTWSFNCAHTFVSSSVLIRELVKLGEGPPRWPHFTLITSLLALSPNTATVWGTGVRMLTYELKGGGTQFSPSHKQHLVLLAWGSFKASSHYSPSGNILSFESWGCGGCCDKKYCVWMHVDQERRPDSKVWEGAWCQTGIKFLGHNAYWICLDLPT